MAQAVKKTAAQKRNKNNKVKGANAETAVAKYLKQFVPDVERRKTEGAYDRGDIAGMVDTVIEVKSGQYQFPEWLRQLDAEVKNAKVGHGVVIVKPVGVGFTKVDEWFVVMPVKNWLLMWLTHPNFGARKPIRKKKA